MYLEDATNSVGANTFMDVMYLNFSKAFETVLQQKYFIGNMNVLKETKW